MNGIDTQGLYFKCSRPSKYEAGFTLIELVVVLGIIVLISVVSIVGIQIGDRELATDRAAQKLAQDVRRTIDLALRAGLLTSCPGSGEVSAYALHFENATYETANFGMVDGTKNYLMYVECDGILGYDKDDDVDVELIVLENGVEIEELRDGSGAVNAYFDVVFEPPYPTVSFVGALGGEGPFRVIIIPRGSESLGDTYYFNGIISEYRNPRSNFPGVCDDGSQAQIECAPSSFPASTGDPQFVYDWYCDPSCNNPNQRSQEFLRLSDFDSSRTVTISKKGVVEVE